MRLKTVSNVALSRDGQRLAYVVDEVDEQRNAVISRLWSLEGDGGQPTSLADEVVSGPFADRTALEWAPDGRTITYLKKTGNTRAIWSVGPGRSPHRVVDIAGDVSFFRYSPDGGSLAAVASPALPASAPDAPIVDGGARPLPARLYIANLTSGAVRAVTPPDAAVSSRFDWSPDGKHLVYETRGDLFVVDAATAAVKPLVERPGTDAVPLWSPGGDSILFASMHGKERAPIGLAVVPAGGGAARDIASQFDTWIAGDAPHWFDWAADGRTVYFAGRRRMEQHLFTVSVAEGTLHQLTTGARVVYPATLSRDRRRIAFVSSDPKTPNDVFVSSTSRLEPRRVTTTNPQLSSTLVGDVERLSWTSNDGLRIEGLLAKPVGYRAGRRYPLVVLMEGTYGTFDLSFSGRVSADGFLSFPTQPQVFAGAGFAVLMPNPRGSWGYGDEFASKGRGDLAVGPHNDIMSGVDALVANGTADPSRLAITAVGSYDSYRLAYALTQTDRFKAAIVGPTPVFNLASWYGQVAFPPFFDTMLGGPPWKVPDRYAQLSPVSFADRIKTPTFIFALGAVEWTKSQGDELATALTMNQVPRQFVVYPNSRAFQLAPQALRDALTRGLDWVSGRLRE